MKKLHYRFGFKGMVLLPSSINNNKLCAMATCVQIRARRSIINTSLNINSALEFLDGSSHLYYSKHSPLETFLFL